MNDGLSPAGAGESGSSNGAGPTTSSNGAGPTTVLGPKPAATGFVAATEWLESGIPVVSVIGELDLATAWVLEETLLGLSDGTAETVIVDLARCGFIDLTGLRALLAAHKRLEHSDRTLALVTGDRGLLRIFKITRVTELFEIHPSLSAAIEADESD